MTQPKAYVPLLHLLLLGATIAICSPVQAELVPLKWESDGQFKKELRVPPGKFVELCDRLPAGAMVTWGFEAGTPLNFNIHYHEGKEVRFPAKKDEVTSDAGTLNVKVEQDYCWMWTNKRKKAATLELSLKRE